MVEKKLLTLAGVVGILACGACFLPPLPQYKPVPPPIRNGLDGVQNIRVEVANASPSHHLDSADLARKIADAINEQSWKTRVSADVGKEAGGEDAVLSIAVLSEIVESTPQAKTGRMTFLIEDSATLTRLDGALEWRETEAGNLIDCNVATENPTDAWKESGLVDGMDKALSDRLVLRMFYWR
ncbi:MAG: hypothetical protein WAK26_01875 [Terracidiphilus sp.]|jgi:hypothetical protein